MTHRQASAGERATIKVLPSNPNHPRFTGLCWRMKEILEWYNAGKSQQREQR
jgi:hypothetical protein